VVVNSADPEATVAFYERHLGFATSDVLMHPHMGRMMWFLRCNDWHHSFAVTRAPHAALHHASFELRGIDEYMRGSGRLLRAGVEKVWGPGRHKAGNNTFSYFLDPQGNTLEYTTELERLDEDTWHPGLHDFSDPDVSDQWGTANPMDEFVARKSFNDPDKGLFVPPPV
jgi:catechol 2,3-dioxygenase-like lactoylglutathione lyase family enzyme